MAKKKKKIIYGPFQYMDPRELCGTMCCALTQINAYEWMSAHKINVLVKRAARNGYRAVFIIQKKVEPSLTKKLRSLKFRPLVKFSRRVSYDSTKLTMWFKSW